MSEPNEGGLVLNEPKAVCPICHQDVDADSIVNVCIGTQVIGTFCSLCHANSIVWAARQAHAEAQADVQSARMAEVGTPASLAEAPGAEECDIYGEPIGPETACEPVIDPAETVE